MALEIERRFLVREGHAIWTSDSVSIVQGYIPLRSGGNVRIRITGQDAVMTIKRWVGPGVREERNTPISFWNAATLLKTRCVGGIVEKTRHHVTVGDHLWEVDFFTGANEGLVIAEVELDHPQEPVELPDWVSDEITGDRRYGNSMLAKQPYGSWDGLVPFPAGRTDAPDAGLRAA
ncbi:CYTH domain-containing protein [Azospirillum sp. SYSU D00513]|uniref:CYTH domain-containing protein n=1 Tax=Azospirillum sp. SYSU D00513 TaxID=2812561 RepID=UPI001A97305E|nr:CYTH domain-containing protein [Azospirillum sp. SYSU D00513]